MANDGGRVMADLRERLVELVQKPMPLFTGRPFSPVMRLSIEHAEELADHMINNGVTMRMNNPYWENICTMAERQRNKGLSVYGQGLEYNHADIIERINHLQEELIDGLMYCEWIKDKLGGTEGG